MREAKKPKGEQLITADLFIEINKAYNVIENYAPETKDVFDKGEFVDSMVKKYTDGTISSVTSFRQLSKMARAELAGVPKEDAVRAIEKLVRKKSYSVDDAYKDTVQWAYERRDLISRIAAITERLESLPDGALKAPELREALEELRKNIDKVLR